MFARSVLHTLETSGAREASGRSSRRSERETGTIAISRDSAKRKRNARAGGEGEGEGEASYGRVGGKEEPEEWIEDVRRPVHHLCRPTGIAASASVRRGGG